MKLPPIHFLEAFESVARLKSMVGAANELNVTPSAISHRIANLELHLDIHLFDKKSKYFELTDQGQDYLIAIQDCLDQITTATNLLSKHHSKDVIKIDCCQSFARLWLLPKIKLFLKNKPNVLIQMGDYHKNNDRNPKSNFQISRRPIPFEGIVLKNLFRENITPLATPKLINQLKIKNSKDLLRCPLIYSVDQKKWWSSWFDKSKLNSPKLSLMSGMEHSYLSLEAAHQELGIVIESIELSKEYLSNSFLTPVFPSVPPISMPGYQISYENDRIEKNYLHEFKEWIFEQVYLDQVSE